MVGSAKSDEKFVAALEEQLGLAPPAEKPTAVATAGDAPKAKPEVSEEGGTKLEVTREAGRLTFAYPDGDHAIDLNEVPLWGGADAKEVRVLLVDFRKARSRSAARNLLDAQAQAGDTELAIALLPAMPTGEAQQIHKLLAPGLEIRPGRLRVTGRSTALR